MFSNLPVLKNSWNQQISREQTLKRREIFPTQVKAVVSYFSNINIKAVTSVADEHSCPVAATRHLVSCNYVFVFQTPDSHSGKSRGQKLTRQEVGAEEEEKTFTLSSANVSIDTFPTHLLRRNSSFSRITRHSVTALTFDMRVVNCQKTVNYSRNKKRTIISRGQLSRRERNVSMTRISNYPAAAAQRETWLHCFLRQEACS